MLVGGCSAPDGGRAGQHTAHPSPGARPCESALGVFLSNETAVICRFSRNGCLAAANRTFLGEVLTKQNAGRGWCVLVCAVCESVLPSSCVSFWGWCGRWTDAALYVLVISYGGVINQQR